MFMFVVWSEYLIMRIKPLVFYGNRLELEIIRFDGRLI